MTIKTKIGSPGGGDTPRGWRPMAGKGVLLDAQRKSGRFSAQPVKWSQGPSQGGRTPPVSVPGGKADSSVNHEDILAFHYGDDLSFKFAQQQGSWFDPHTSSIGRFDQQYWKPDSIREHKQNPGGQSFIPGL